MSKCRFDSGYRVYLEFLARFYDKCLIQMKMSKQGKLNYCFFFLISTKNFDISKIFWHQNCFSLGKKGY